MQYSPQWLLSTERLRVQTCSKNLGLLFYVFFTSISEADGDNDRSGVLFLTVIFVAGLLKNLYDVAMLLEYGESRVDGGPYKGNESTADTPLFIRFFFLNPLRVYLTFYIWKPYNAVFTTIVTSSQSHISVRRTKWFSVRWKLHGYRLTRRYGNVSPVRGRVVSERGSPRVSVGRDTSREICIYANFIFVGRSSSYTVYICPTPFIGTPAERTCWRIVFF